MAYYDYIRIYGAEESEAECFQGLGAAALYNAPVTQPQSGGDDVTVTTGGEKTPSVVVNLPEEDNEIDADLWKAQEMLLARQIGYLKDIKDTYAEKRQDLPQGFSMRNFTQSDFFKWAVEFALTLIPGDIDDTLYKLIQEHAHKVVGWALVWLQKAYYAGSLLCAAMADENAYLAKLPPTRKNYELRSTIITQHDQSIQSLLQQVALAESQAAQMAARQTLDEEKRVFMKEALSERVFECPYSGLCLGEKNAVAESSEFSLKMD